MSAELAELGSELGIRSARAMFAAMSTHAAAITRSSSPTTAAPEGGPSTSTGGGVNSPPASISSSSSSDSPPRNATLPAQPQTPTRPRAVGIYSPLAATSCTPPTSPARRGQLHPFFQRRAPPPPARMPRLVAEYASSSSEACSQESRASESSWGSGNESPSGSPTGQRQGRGGDGAMDLFAVADELARLRVSDTGHGLPRLVPIPRAVDTGTATTFRPTAVEVAADVPTAAASASASTNNAPPLPAWDEIDASTNAFSDPVLDPIEPEPAPFEPLQPSTSLPLFTYRTPLTGHFTKPPTVVYTTNPAEADDLVACLNGDVLGLDLEWPLPGAGPVKVITNKDGSTRLWRQGEWDVVQRKYVWNERRTTVIQVCDEKMVVVLHLLRGAEPGPGLVSLIADPTRYKTGVAVRGDGQKLMRDFAVFKSTPPQGLLDLSYIVRELDTEKWGAGRRLVALSKIVAAYLDTELDKGLVRSSFEGETWDPEQLEYAANDVFASLLVYNELARRASLKETKIDRNKHAVSLAPVPLQPRPPKAKASTEPTANINVANDGGAVEVPIDDFPFPALSRHPRWTLLDSYSRGRQFKLFAAGGEIDQLAKDYNLKRTTVESYVVQTAMEFDVGVLPTPIRRRIVDEVEVDGWAATKNEFFFRKLRDSLEDVKEDEVVTAGSQSLNAFEELFVQEYVEHHRLAPQDIPLPDTPTDSGSATPTSSASWWGYLFESFRSPVASPAPCSSSASLYFSASTPPASPSRDMSRDI